MASVFKRRNKFSIVYYYTDEQGVKRQKWETRPTYAEAMKRKTEIEYQQSTGEFIAPSTKTVRVLLEEFVELYGATKWALSTYSAKRSIIDNYINPYIGDIPLQDLNTKAIDKFYKRLETVPPIATAKHKPRTKFIGANQINEIHKILHSALEQAVRWGELSKNPSSHAILPKVTYKKREIWTSKEIATALENCGGDRFLFLAINLSFACSLRVGEITGLTWDCVDLENGTLLVNKELARVTHEAMEALNNKDILFIFPAVMSVGTTRLVLKTPKTESSVRTIYLPKTLIAILRKWKRDQDELKHFLKDEYQDYNLVLAQKNGRPYEERLINKAFNEVIAKTGLPKVVFHSLRHSSTTYKLKLSGGNVKMVQGDTGHAQATMVTETYAHILDEDRRVNADAFEEMFYGNLTLGDPEAEVVEPQPTPTEPDVPAARSTQEAMQTFVQEISESPEMLETLFNLLSTAISKKN